VADTDPKLQTSRAAAALIVASWLCWLLGVSVALIAVFVFAIGTQIPSIRFAFAPWSLVMLALAGGYCTAAYLLRKLRPPGAWLAVLSAGAATIVRPLPDSRLVPLAVAINAIMLLLVLVNWRTLHGYRRQVGA
jgi:Ca2+/Na+ antiporter